MSNRIVKALEHGAEKLGKTLAKDASKAVQARWTPAGSPPCTWPVRARTATTPW
ncbi:hypothetical protein ACIGW8_09840 [Streptomyces sioyaensis]|uniref:hypothetical protein n=1 Tax=Streptomyces sioyaensis TaxID=67364 RepID=UPI0037CECD8B